MRISPISTAFFTSKNRQYNTPESAGVTRPVQKDSFIRRFTETPEEKVVRLYAMGKESGNFDRFNNYLKTMDRETMVQSLVDLSEEYDEVPIVNMRKENIKSLMSHSKYGTFLKIALAENSHGSNFLQLASASKISSVIGYLNHDDLVWGLEKANFSGSNAFHMAEGNPDRQRVFYNNLTKREILDLSTRQNDYGLSAFSLYKGKEFSDLIERFDEKDLSKAVEFSNINGNTYFNYLPAPELKLLCSKMNPEDVRKFALLENSKKNTPFHTQSPESVLVLLSYFSKDEIKNIIFKRNNLGETPLKRREIEKAALNYYNSLEQ